ncbi:Unknown protein sequence [Pseudomonas syringae pv. spinaceae]|uniref:Uncharacterized protein n=1 Tax=Pseudomonas syringae pv. spinaceae TaxID=264459 RepID=A0A0Q0GB72_PSESX|nr:Unknown protein sequence [Pseudomonas syringae pv. spinaceae]
MPPFHSNPSICHLLQPISPLSVRTTWADEDGQTLFESKSTAWSSQSSTVWISSRRKRMFEHLFGTLKQWMA